MVTKMKQKNRYGYRHIARSGGSDDVVVFACFELRGPPALFFRLAGGGRANRMLSGSRVYSSVYVG